MSDLLFTFLEDGQVETVVLGEGDPGLLALSEDEHVTLSGGEDVAVGVLQVDDVEGSDVLLDVGDDTDPTDVVPGDDVGDVAHLQLHVVGDLLLDQVVLDGVTNLNFRVGESDGSGVVGHDVGDLVGAQLLINDLT